MRMRLSAIFMILYAAFLFAGRVESATPWLPPRADAGPDQTVNEGEFVALNGSASFDWEGAPLAYQWVQVAGDLVTMDFTDPVYPTFIAPEVPLGGSTFTFELTVSNGYSISSPDAVNVTVMNINHPPVADAGDDQLVSEYAVVMFDGSASYDPDGEGLTYLWVQVEGTPVFLSDPEDATLFFDAPTVGPEGELLVFELTVSDGDHSATDWVSVFVENRNHAPVAKAGPDQTMEEGSQVWLDGTASSDPDGDSLDYHWLQISGPLVTLMDPQSPTPSFIAPITGPGGDVIVFDLSVSDGELTSSPDEVSITLLSTNDPPACDLASATVEQLWPPNHKMVEVRIVGIADPDDDDVIITVTGVTQDEPLNGLGDGDTSPDAIIQEDGSVLLRAERSGIGNGRVYRITFSAEDELGETCSGAVSICVPHDRRDNSCQDDGQLYDSLQP